METNELAIAQTRLANAQARMIEIDVAEREKTLRPVDDCWRHILRFGQAMNSIPISGMRERDIWLQEIDRQMKLSKELLEEKSI